MISTTTNVTNSQEKQVKDNCAFYFCDELDCGFKYHYKTASGPSIRKPIVELEVLVVDLNKKVKVRLAGFGKLGYQRLVDHGHEGYIFPIDLFSKPYKINPKPSSSFRDDNHERWLRLIASFKGVTHVSSRKEYILVSESGEVLKRKLFNEEEFKGVLDFHERWKDRHPGEKVTMFWKENNNVNDLHISQPQQA